MSAQPVRNTFRSLSGLGLDGTGCIAGRHNAPVQSELMGQERRAAVAAVAVCARVCVCLAVVDFVVPSDTRKSEGRNSGSANAH